MHIAQIPSPPEQPIPMWLTVAEAAKHLRVSKKALYEAISNRTVPVRRVGKWIRVRRDFVLGTDLKPL